MLVWIKFRIRSFQISHLNLNKLSDGAIQKDTHGHHFAKENALRCLAKRVVKANKLFLFAGKAGLLQ